MGYILYVSKSRSSYFSPRFPKSQIELGTVVLDEGCGSAIVESHGKGLEGKVDKKLSDILKEELGSRSPGLRDNEARRALSHLTARWHMVLTENEKWAIARKLGGNRYASLTLEVLESIMSRLLEDRK